MSVATAAMLVIGDEILSGRTRDSNLHHLAIQLTDAGIDLAEARIVADDQDEIVAAINALRAKHTYVFTSGGIGPTHDDITADAVAAAFGVGIDVRDDARAILEARYAAMGSEINEARLRMARIPDGAALIDNPVSGAPGFLMANVHVMAGVPKVFESMLASVLPTLSGGPPLLSHTIQVFLPEGDVAGPLAEVAARLPDVSFGSYPFQRDGAFGCNLVARSRDAAALDEGVAALRAALKTLSPENWVEFPTQPG